ncbi:MAG TPA: IS21 family transposase [Erysipelotrichaceae bacterium]|jgi:transposase|nr:IS21 family transposase [Erysipelotrichaceae bacterium]
MRIDIYEKVSLYKMNDLKPNFSEVARTYGCDPRTVKRYYEGGQNERKYSKKPSKLDGYKTIIEEKLDLGVSVISIYHFIQDKGYTGKYTILKDYCKRIKKEKTERATIRIETNPGLSAQVDWKEDFSLHTKKGELIVFQIFLMILGCSRYKYFEPTLNREQKTLFKSMINGFEAFGGIPREIWFDNMKTVVDRSKTQYNQVVLNQSFYYFSQDIGYQPIACRPYRPQTKGKVEALARLMDRLKVHDYEIDSYEDVERIIKQFQIDINQEISQATYEKPIILLEKEKEHLKPLPSADMIAIYKDDLIERKVSKEAMVTLDKVKYSVSTQYINKVVRLKILEDILHIYYNEELISKHKISKERFNYHKQDALEILKSDVMKDKTDQDIEAFIQENINIYDEL